MTKVVQLPPIKESDEDYEALEKRLKELFRREIYLPLLRILGESHNVLSNAADENYGELLDALRFGKVVFQRGVFSGRFTAGVTKLLRQLGAKWEKKTGTFHLPLSALPISLRAAIAGSEHVFKKKLEAIDARLKQILPDELAAKFKGADLFDRALWKTNKKFLDNVRSIGLAPALTEYERVKLSKEWSENMRLWIRDFADKEIKLLRVQMAENIFEGRRYGDVIKTIERSYGVSANKAKFLASQETRLAVNKFKEARYVEAGIHEYTWCCVTGTKLHPVREYHQRLNDEKGPDGKKKIRRFDDPPVTDKNGNRNNPGEDYNCRCYARAVIRFR